MISADSGLPLGSRPAALFVGNCKTTLMASFLADLDIFAHCFVTVHT